MKKRQSAAHDIYRALLNPEISMVPIEKGHTPEVSKLGAVHCGRATSECFMLGVFAGKGADTKILSALKVLQIRDENSPHHGLFRWYHEEKTVHDTNAAFFIAQPLLLAAMEGDLLRDKGVGPDLLEIFRGALAWFREEKRQPKYFYTNKVVSDASLLFALEWLVEGRHDGDGKDFLNAWCDYTENMGWGWGENMSPSYAQLTLIGLCLAIGVARRAGAGDTLVARLKTHLDTLASTLIAHAPHHFVPAIRTYNFAGETTFRLPFYELLGHGVIGAQPASFKEAEANYWVVVLEWLVGFGGLALPAEGNRPAQEFRRERVWRDNHATTWIGRNIRLGGMERFPVLKGCYQGKNGGLGWQSMPVGFLARERDYGCLQWRVEDREGRVRTHPASGYHAGYLATELFEAGPLGNEVHTFTSQSGPLLLAARLAWAISPAQANGVADSLLIARFQGECLVDGAPVESGMEVPAGRWIVLSYPDCALAVQSLETAAGRPAGLRIIREGQSLRIERDLPAEWREAWWLLRAYDRVLDERECRALAKPVCTVTSSWDAELPRSEVQSVRRVAVGHDGETCELTIDPYRVY